MKTKKKPTTPKLAPPVKLLNVKTLQPEKNLPSSNQKHFMTIDDNVRTFQNAQTQFRRDSFKARFSFSKKSYHERMEQHNLSPFSNDGRSASPKCRKTPEKLIAHKQEKQVKFAINLKELDKKKPKPKVNSARQSYAKKLSTPSNAKTVALNAVKQENAPIKKKPVLKKKKSQKADKQQKARIEFQNQFLSMMNNRIHKQKITQMSDEQQEGSIKKKKPNLEICIQSEGNSSREDKKLREKKEIVKTMQLKVMKNIQRDYPNLDVGEKRVICAVIIVQRLWRQRKVKQFFEHYVTPKASPECSFRESLQKEVSSSDSTMNLLTSHIVKKQPESKSCEAVKAPRKKPAVTLSAQDSFLMRQASEESCSQLPQTHKIQSVESQKNQSRLNEKVTRLFQASILPFENDNQKIIKEASNIDKPSMIKFIECYREIKLSGAKKQTKSKRNIFSLKQSLSEKCLMQTYYTRIFSDRPQKDRPKNYELFSLNSSSIGNESLKQNQQSSIELFKQISRHPDYVSPQKLLNREEDEEVWVRNETNYSQDTDSEELLGGNGEKKEVNSRKVVVDEILYDEGFFTKDVAGINVQCLDTGIVISPKEQRDAQMAQQDDASCGIVINHRAPQPEYPNKSSFQSQTKEKPEFSLKSIQKVSQSVITQLLNEFFSQYISFQQKQCLVKKHRSSKQKQQEKQKKPKLPGIVITPHSITQYLDILIPFILNQDRQQVLKSLQLFHPSTYQKCHRVQSPVYQLFQFADQEDDDIYWNIITNEGFFACLEEYWKRNVTLSKEQEKFTNFLDLTYKVYNRCITDAFSQIFNKQVLEKIIYPWNRLAKTKQAKINFSSQIKTILNSSVIQTIALQVKQKLLKQSFCYSTTDGKLVKKDRKPRQPSKKEYEFGQIKQQQMLVQKLSDDEFSKVMKIADDQFLQDQKELMHCADERYELCGDVSEAVLDELMREVERELLGFQEMRLEEEVVLTKSQQEVFLETNETLETNYHF